MQPTGEIRTYRSEEDDKNARPTAAGCLLLLLCVVAIFGLAVPIVMWRDEQNQALPRSVAIALPLLAGALCYGIGALILRILGISILTRSEDEVGMFDDGKATADESIDHWKRITDTVPTQGDIVETISYDSQLERHRITMLKRDASLSTLIHELFKQIPNASEDLATWNMTWLHPNGSVYEGDHGEPTHWRPRPPNDSKESGSEG